MSLPVPKLDDRSFQQLVDEAKKRIPYYTSEWTDHNVSDPGVTLIELFAWMMETVLFRVNQVPDLHYIKFMDMLGIRLQEAVPAQALITFWLNRALEADEQIEQGTEVASIQTEKQSSVIFTTDADLNLSPPVLNAIMVDRFEQRGKYSENFVKIRRELEIFSPQPMEFDAIYFGFDNDVSHHLLRFNFEFKQAMAKGVNPNLPPIVWEVATGEPFDLQDATAGWEICDVDDRVEPRNDTRGLNQKGMIDVHLPAMSKVNLNGQSLYWVRLRTKVINNVEKQEGMTRYERSPVLQRLAVETIGGSVNATHTQIVENELIGRSDGSPGQRFNLKMFPLLKRTTEEVIEVRHDENELWEEVPNFSDSTNKSKHYTIDSVSGEVRFGPAVRQPNGDIKMYGIIPPKGAGIVIKSYRVGGGIAGNVRQGFLKTLKTSNALVKDVQNRNPATGGEDGESLEAAMMRAPNLLKTRGRAVTASDFEFMALQAVQNDRGKKILSRVKCLQMRSDQKKDQSDADISVLVIPNVYKPSRRLSDEELTIEDETLEKIRAYLDARRLLTTKIDIRLPVWKPVSVHIRLKELAGVKRDVVEKRIIQKLEHFINPITGGMNRDGWEFGRTLYMGDVFQCLQGIQDVAFVQSIELRGHDEQGRLVPRVRDEIPLDEDEVLISGAHSVGFV